MTINYQHADYRKQINKWKLVDDICDYGDVQQYLIQLNPDDLSRENATRNTQYRERAVFYPVAGHTVRGLVSLIFSKPPKLNVPSQLEYLGKNCDGAGVSIYQQAQDLADDVISKSRGGLLVSYPETKEAVSRADMNALKYFATIHEIEAEQIINWRTETIGAQMKLSLVVIKEEAEEIQPDGYEVKCVLQYRELALVNTGGDSRVFVVRVWRKNEKDDTWYVVSESIPVDGFGNTWDEIPFTFVGTESNSSDVDKPNLYPLAMLNLGHYRNSADYEDSVYFCGQAQAWMSGMTQAHVDLMTQAKMYVGSRQMLGVPSGETFGIVSASSNTMVRQAMLDKLDAMVGFGARFIQAPSTNKTATEANSDAKIQHSLLSMVSGNISEAYDTAIQWCARYMAVDAPDASFETTQDFISPEATAQDIQQIVATFIQGALPMTDYLNWMQTHGLVDGETTIEDFSALLNVASMPNLDTPATAPTTAPPTDQQPAPRPILSLPVK